jgi:mono/diheme cytochrome c family protein
MGWITLAAHTLVVGWVALAAPAQAGPDFTTEVRPILSQHCFKCHGPDEPTRKGGLRLDVRDSAVQAAKSGAVALVPGQPQSSELVKRIHSKDPDEVMPPPSTRQTLTAAEKKTLEAWISAGAEYVPHWAFQPPKAVPPPDAGNSPWPRNPIDQFVLQRLAQRGLSPSESADLHALARRVSLDLIGLPPTPAEVEEFLKDPSDAGYERWVDRLLASPRYGERWARRWMDLARYADTNG